MKDQIKGGLADKKKPSDFDPKMLAMGVKVEMEHTSDKQVATEIAMDHLMEDPKYYVKLKGIEKYDRERILPDGKIDRDYGKEELNKEPIKKSIFERWLELKKALDSSKAFLDMEEAQEVEEDAPEEEAGAEEMPQEEAAQDEMGGEDGGAADSPEEAETAPEGDMDGAEEAQGGGEPEEEPEEDDEEIIIQALKNEGYSDKEIAYIVHGAIPPEATVDDYKMANEKAGGDQKRELEQKAAEIDHSHKARMNDLEYERSKAEMIDPSIEENHQKRMKDVEYDSAKRDHEAGNLDIEHKKRLLDLEYQKAKEEAQLEVEYKKRENELKLKQLEEKNKHQMAMQAEKNKHQMKEQKANLAQDAAKTSQAERKGK